MKKVTESKSIIIDNQKFDYNTGCGLLKLKYDKCPFPEMEDFWDDIKPCTFKQISSWVNIETRRVGIKCLGIERLVKEIKPKMVDVKTIKKETTWVDKDGELISKKFKDTYELYEVSGTILTEGSNERWRKRDNFYYVKCKDTSTDREYMIWVDLPSVYRTNNSENDRYGHNYEPKKVDVVSCIAWTITTNVPEGKIDSIIRQGDCILVKPKPRTKLMDTDRHLTKREYLELLVCES